MNHYAEPAWQPCLIVALVGALVIACGIGALFVQLYVSVRDRAENRDLTGDPWDARSLEWSTASPAPFYNFAHVPRITSLEQHWDDKQRKRANVQPRKYEDIHMPRNTAAGVVISAFGTVLCFALVWHIWWLAVASLIGVIATFIARTYDRDVDYWVPAGEVERIENVRHAQLAEVA